MTKKAAIPTKSVGMAAFFIGMKNLEETVMSRKLEYGLLAVFSIIFLIAGGYLFRIWEEYHEAASDYQKLQKYRIEKTGKGTVEGDDSLTGDFLKDGEDAVQIDFDGLRAINEDIVAWIQIPEISVDYPVVQGEDNEYYLHYTFERKANIAGSIFLDCRNRADFTDQKVILYGHNMQDGSMFSGLGKYQDDSFREEQGRVILYLPNKTLECEIVECRQISVQDSVYGISQGVEEKVPDEIVLSTCSSLSNMRLILECNILNNDM